MKTTFIYSLSFPEGNIRYIGKTDKPKRRIINHIYEAKRNKYNSHKNNWIRKVLSEGGEPIFSIIEEVDYEKWEEKEIYYIAHYKSLGFDLINKNKGGTGLKFHTPETREKLKELSKGNKWALGHKVSDKAKEQNRLAHLGKKASSETRKKMSDNNAKWNLGKNLSEETIDKIKEARSKQIITEETKQKMSLKKQGRKHSMYNPIPILQYDLNDNLIKEWKDGIELKENGFKTGDIYAVCRGVQKTAFGFKWKRK